MGPSSQGDSFLHCKKTSSSNNNNNNNNNNNSSNSSSGTKMQNLAVRYSLLNQINLQIQQNKTMTVSQRGKEKLCAKKTQKLGEVVLNLRNRSPTGSSTFEKSLPKSRPSGLLFFCPRLATDAAVCVKLVRLQPLFCVSVARLDADLAPFRHRVPLSGPGQMDLSF